MACVDTGVVDSTSEVFLAAAAPTAPAAPAAPKRPALDTSSDRAAKRRSTIACLSCRSRKVRCDVVTGGMGCTNCRLDGIQCVVKDSNRGKRPSAAGAAGPSPTVQTQQQHRRIHNHQHQQPQQQQQQQEEGEGEEDEGEGGGGDHDDANSEETQRENQQEQREQREQQQQQQSQLQQRDQHGQQHPRPVPQAESQGGLPVLDQPHEFLVSLSFEDQPRRPHPAESIACERHPQLYIHPHSLSPGDCSTPNLSNGRSGESPAHTSPQELPNHIPPYFRRLPSHIGPEDLEYLKKKDALTIPDDDFRDELLRTYVKVVHPFMPVLDLEAFLVPIISGGSGDPVSFILFQAVMFVSVTFVDAELLRARRFPNRKVARKTFFNRVRFLYSLECERDRLSLIQALLLMTFWYETPEDEKDTWYWMGIAISLAQVMGIHRNPKDLTVDKREKQLRTRIWWSCYTRDRLLALGIRRPVRIQKKDFNVPMISLDDFDLSTLSRELNSLFGGTGLLSESRKVAALLYIELTKLCVCIGHILHTQYSVLGDNPMASEYFSKVMVMPRQSDKQDQEFVKCDAELESWLQNQDSRCRYTPSLSRPTEAQQQSNVIIRLHQALLHMTYLTTLGVLHRPQVFYPRPDPSIRGMNKQESRRTLTKAAIAITKLAYDLQCHNHLRYLSTSSVPAFLSATLVHLLDIRSPEEDVRNISIGRFYQCLQVLHQLRDMYASADSAVYFLQTVLESTKTRIPMLNPGDRFSPEELIAVEDQHPRTAPQQLTTNPGVLNSTLPSYSRYITPSTSRDMHPPIFSPNSNTMVGLDRPTQARSPLNSFGYLTPANNFYCNSQQTMEGISGSMNTISDYDNLFPALLNFDIDSALFTSNINAGPPLH